ncbi:MAG: glycosyltransferase [Acidobacteriota bacterium]
MSFPVIELGPASLDLSIVIPVKNEAANVASLAGEIDEVFAGSRRSWECLWIDDGSDDTTLDELIRLHQASSHHDFIQLDGHLGQSAALAAGFSRARGLIIATLDGDGQNDPADLPPLLALLQDRDADMVNGWRRQRQDHLLRKISSSIANSFRNRLTGERIRDVGCSLRAMRRDCLEHILVFQGMHRFLPTLVRLNGFDRILEVPVGHRPRRHGKTKYGIHDRLWVGIADTMGVRWLSRRVASRRVRRSSLPPSQE